MKLQDYNFPNVTDIDMAFPTFDTDAALLEEAKKRDLKKGRKKFNELFLSGGKVEFKDDVKGSWKESAFAYVKVLMRSYAPRHEDKEAVCAMIFEECLII